MTRFNTNDLLKLLALMHMNAWRRNQVERVKQLKELFTFSKSHSINGEVTLTNEQVHIIYAI